MITTIVEQPRPAILATNAWMQGGVSGDLSQLAGINQLIVKQRFEPIEGYRISSINFPSLTSSLLHLPPKNLTEQ
jgi:hypothetical protein